MPAATEGAKAEDPPPAVSALGNFTLVFRDEFDGDQLDWSVWDRQDSMSRSPSGERVYRGPENIVVDGGLLKLFVAKEEVEGSDWTAACVWLRECFGANTYYESRFLNTNATGVNNAFWTANKTAERGSYANRYEIDCPENKLYADGQIHAHLAWHDWKSYRLSDKQHVAQGLSVKLNNRGFQTWGLWVGENEFAIYYDGDLKWRGQSHKKYHEQWHTGLGKLSRWDKSEERRAYGKHGQEDWSYFGGMNGDVQNVCFSTMPWASGGSSLTRAADGTSMGIDYLRVYKRSRDLNPNPIQLVERLTPGLVALAVPVEATRRETRYISLKVRVREPAPLSLALLANGNAEAVAGVRPDGSLRLWSGGNVANSLKSYPARDFPATALQAGTDYLLIARVTTKESGRDILSIQLLDLAAPVPQQEPYLYHNVDARGNTNATSEWGLSQSTTLSSPIDGVRLSYDPRQVTCHDLRVGKGYRSVVHPRIRGTAAVTPVILDTNSYGCLYERDGAAPR